MARQRVSAVIIQDQKILLIHRIKSGSEYYTFPGGGVEGEETLEEALIREVKEETNLDIDTTSVQKLWEYANEEYGKDHGTDPQQEYYFLIKQFQGDLKLGGPEVERNSPENLYALEWVNLDKVSEINLIPAEMQKRLIQELALLALQALTLRGPAPSGAGEAK